MAPYQMIGLSEEQEKYFSERLEYALESYQIVNECVGWCSCPTGLNMSGEILEDMGFGQDRIDSIMKRFGEFGATCDCKVLWDREL